MPILGDIKSNRLIVIKGLLFLLLGLLSLAAVAILSRDWRIVFCAIVAAWAFSRFYYFAFYVIEKYVDPSYKFAGLGSFLLWLFKRK